MNHKIAVEPNLSPVKEFLTSKGYDVREINYGSLTNEPNEDFDAVVITGMDRNFLGMHDLNTKAIIIDAEGMNAEQVYDELKSRLG